MKFQFFVLVFLLVGQVFAQNAIVTWGLTANQTVTSTTGNVSGVTQTLSNMTVNSYQAVTGSGTGNSQLSIISGGSWPAESAQNASRYVQFKMSPVSGNNLVLSSITLYYGGKGGGNVKGNIAISTDSTFATSTQLNASTLAVSSSSGTMSALSYSPTTAVNDGQTLYLRVYPWYTSASGGKYLCLQNLVISGNTTAAAGTPPAVTTTTATSITATTAQTGGNVTSAGSSSVTARGICYATTSNPLISGTHTTDGTGTGTFTTNLSNLQPGTLYYYKAYAQSSVDVSYGSEYSFSTPTTTPTVSTSAVSYLGVTNVIAGGNVSTTGGANVTDRGIVWGTSVNPTTANNVVASGSGTGNYSATISSLTAGSTYHYRAYATNSNGTSYGLDSSFTTLASALIPTVTTSSASGITSTSTSTGGNVTFDGGAAVTQRGICWNVTGSPTTSDNTTTDGAGGGQFSSTIVSLTPNSIYYIKAYAINSAGTGYGSQITVNTLSSDGTIVVASDGTGNYLKVGDALRNASTNSSLFKHIYIKNGTYYEKDTLLSTVSNILIEGQSKDSTIITYDDYSGRVVNGTTLGTSTSQTLWIRANDVTLKNLTIQNTSQAAQAVALNVQSDRVYISNCKLLGYQDTYYNWNSGRVYHKNCYIEGSVDFIFGNGICLFDSCTINCNRNGGTLTAANTVSTYSYGYVFTNCTITSNVTGYDGNPVTTFYLGRPWQNSPQTVFINCVEPSNLNAAGWLAWNVTPTLFAEYNCSGPGSATGSRVSWSRQLTSTEAANYNATNMFSRASATPNYTTDWFVNPGMLPVELTSFSALEQGRDIVLQWTTATEVQNSGWQIERAVTDSKTPSPQWKSIGFVSGAGNSASGKSYTYRDVNPGTGEYSYRLKQIDLDGTVSYSSTIFSSVSTANGYWIIDNYPNPFNPSTTITFNVPERAKVDISIYNSLGEFVTRIVNETFEKGTYSRVFEANKLSSGIYYYRLQSGSNLITKKMILTK